MRGGHANKLWQQLGQLTALQHLEISFADVDAVGQVAGVLQLRECSMLTYLEVEVRHANDVDYGKVVVHAREEVGVALSVCAVMLAVMNVKVSLL